MLGDQLVRFIGTPYSQRLTMPNWKQLLEELKTYPPPPNPFDAVRRKYLKQLHDVTGRNVIVYYSGWLEKEGLWNMREKVVDFGINDGDKTGFMTCIHNLDRNKGLDLVLHTPGGDIAATESLVHYLREMFDIEIRAIIPQIAMSAGTMIACSCKEILMGKHSNLGPIDPHISGIPAYGVLVEFERARREIAENPANIPLWQPILSRYSPTFIGECLKVLNWSKTMVTEWLTTGMFKDEGAKAEAKAEEVVSKLGYPDPGYPDPKDVSSSNTKPNTKPHAWHITREEAINNIGLDVFPFDGKENDDLQDAILSAHHACIFTLSGTPAYKIIENHEGVAYIKNVAPGKPA